MEINELIIGKKPPGLYLRTARRIISQSKVLKIKTRGRSIGDAVFIALLLSEKKDVKIKETKIFSSKFVGKDGNERIVPEIEINLIR